jgi:membrane protease YdiL (CAAX protease family)
MNVSFGKGELLGFALALFAATLSRWIAHEGTGREMLWSLSTFGLALAAAAIAVVWLSGYQVETGQEKDLFIPTSSVVLGSWVLVVASFVIGAIGEIMYARSLRPTAVKLW